jgi:ABC-type glycerol-3-phosphate transport system substrate-binding protein
MTCFLTRICLGALALNASAALAADGLAVQARPPALSLEEAFSSPSAEAKPWVFWWFEGGYGGAEGMRRDIAAMKEQGIGGVLHMQTVNSGGLPGEPLPVVTFDAATQTAEVRRPDQLYTLQFTGGEHPPASFTARRNGTQLSTL